MTKIIQRHDTVANWTSVNPVLAAGEMGVETDTNKFKFGDGVTAWNSLAYAAGEGGGDSYTKTETDNLLNTKQDKLTAKAPLKIAEEGVKELDNLKIRLSGYDLTDDFTFKINNTTTGGGAYLITTSYIPCNTADYWSIVIRTKFSNTSPLFYSNNFQDGFYFAADVICLSTNGQIWQYRYNPSLSSIVGTDVYIKYEYTGNSYRTAYSRDDVTYTTINTFNTNAKIKHDISVGIAHSNSSSNYYNGEIYFNDSYYTVNGVKYPFVTETGELTISNTPATTSSLGVVQPDGTSITVNEAGIISGQDVKTFTGYSDTGTLVLKSINGVLQWVAES